MKGFVVEELRCVALDPSNQRSADPGCGPLRGRENPVHDKEDCRVGIPQPVVFFDTSARPRLSAAS
jgi:hypothetical protein